MNTSRKSGWVALGLALLVWAPVRGQDTPADSLVQAAAVAATDSLPPEFLILPVVNYSEKVEAHNLLTPRLHHYLDQLGVTYRSSDELRPLLREHRIRSRGWIGLEGAGILHQETGAKYLLLGSWDILRLETNPEIGLSLRVLDLESLVVISAVSVGLTGDDFTQALGLGRITSIEVLANIAMRRAVDALFPLPTEMVPRLSNRGCFKLALIPFDNYSNTPNAGDIVTNIVLSRLLAQGYFVVEPGFVRELGLSLEIINRGGVDRESARSILANFDACLVVTGTVEKFDVARGMPALTVPEMALGIRAMSPLDGNLYMMEELHGAGDEGEGMFQGGRIHALVPLANKVLQDFVDDLATNNREDILYGDQSP